MTLHKEYKKFLADGCLHVKDSTRANYERVLSYFPEPEDQKIATYLRDMLKNDSANATVELHKTIAKAALNFLGKETDKINLVKIGSAKEITIQDLYTKEELQTIFNSANNTRDRAMFRVLYESASRARELLSMSFEGLEFHENGTATVIVTGKTGTRKIPLYESVPALRDWINVHPNGEGKLWVALNKEPTGIAYQTLYGTIKKALRSAGILEDKRRIIHSFRHTRITELVKKGVRGQALNKLVGWRKGSNMESVYVHLSDHDVQNELEHKIFGLGEKAEEPQPLIKAEVCPRCGERNAEDTAICTNCNMPLSNDAVVKALSKETEIDKLKAEVEGLAAMVKMLVSKGKELTEKEIE